MSSWPYSPIMSKISPSICASAGSAHNDAARCVSISLPSTLKVIMSNWSRTSVAACSRYWRSCIGLPSVSCHINLSPPSPLVRPNSFQRVYVKRNQGGIAASGEQLKPTTAGIREYLIGDDCFAIIAEHLHRRPVHKDMNLDTISRSGKRLLVNTRKGRVKINIPRIKPINEQVRAARIVGNRGEL